VPEIVVRVIRIAILVAVMSGLLYLYSCMNQQGQTPSEQTPTPMAAPVPRSEGPFYLS